MKKLLWGKEKQKFKNGDILVGKDVKTKNPVKLGRDDRRRSMLVFGPTGCGKISLTLLPLIEQDIKKKEMGMTIIEPTGELAEESYNLAIKNNRKALYFNPWEPDCPRFNPLSGEESEVCEQMSMVYEQMNLNAPQFFKDMNGILIRNAIKVVKRLYQDEATLIDVSNLVHNVDGKGRKMVQQLMRIETHSKEMKMDNQELNDWFICEYFNERSKTKEHCSGFRAFLSKILSNPSTKKIFTAKSEEKTIDFDKHLAEGEVVIVSTAHGLLREVGLFLGLSLVQKFQAATFRLTYNGPLKKGHSLYINEPQLYINKEFPSFISHAGKYGLITLIAAQSRQMLSEKIGETVHEKQNYTEMILTNIRNVILYPGNYEDFLYFSERWNSSPNKHAKELSNMFAYKFGEAQYSLVSNGKLIRGIVNVKKEVS